MKNHKKKTSNSAPPKSPHRHPPQWRVEWVPPSFRRDFWCFGTGDDVSYFCWCPKKPQWYKPISRKLVAIYEKKHVGIIQGGFWFLDSKIWEHWSFQGVPIVADLAWMNHLATSSMSGNISMSRSVSILFVWLQKHPSWCHSHLSNLSIQECHLPSSQTATFVDSHCYKDHVHMSIYKLMSSKGEITLIPQLPNVPLLAAGDKWKRHMKEK